jgi:alpha-beta hydrolase superfamily lysophospholipase
MRSLSRASLALALSVSFAAAASAAEFKRVPFSTVDGVELEGTFYPGKKDVTVLLLHNFDPRAGGSSHQDGWDHLAEKLQEAGYSVFSFDFRGFGNSKTLSNANHFWSAPHNRSWLRGGGTKLPETIDQKNFPANYYYNLINDIEAAKAYLDRKNDAGEINTSNLVIIGAGEGASLGALWLQAQCRLHRDRANILGAPPALDEAECKDVAAAVWLSIRPTFNGRTSVRSALYEAARDQKIPMAFVYGEREKGGAADFAHTMEQNIKKPELKFTGGEAIKKTELSGSKLLDNSLNTEEWIVEKYLAPVIEARGIRERKKREMDKFAYYWARTKAGIKGPMALAKRPGEELLPIIPSAEYFGGGP